MNNRPNSLLLIDVLDDHAARIPTGSAVRCADVDYSWHHLSARVAQLAEVLRRAGVGRHDRVAWIAQNCHRYLEALLACSSVGATFAPLNWRQSEHELTWALADVEPRLVLWQHEEIGALIDGVHRHAPADVPWVQIDADPSDPDGYEGRLQELPDVALPTESNVQASTVQPADPVLLLYTAAFDGRPAGALLTQTGLLIQASYGIQFAGVGPADVYLNSGPLFHVGTLKTTLATFLAGGVNVFVARVDADELCRVIDREHCTGAFLQTPTIDAMVAANADGRYDLSSLRAKPGSDAWNAMVSPAPPARYRSGYGQTEVGGVVTFVDGERPAVGSAGWAAPLVRVAALRPDGGVARPGEVGELAVRGPVVIDSYHRRPELTAARQHDGWHHTADLGRIEADGSVTFVGPATRLIKSAAENIYPAEVEACLRSHPAVTDVAVLGVPDATWGQSVAAVVVAANGSSPSAEELVEHCRSRIASYKKPRTVTFVDALPRRNGQLDRDAIDAAHGGGGYPSSG